MQGMAHVSFQGGEGEPLPAEPPPPLEPEPLLPGEHVEVSTKQHGRFSPNTGDGEFCAACRRSLNKNNLTYWFNGHGQTLCGQCAGRAPH
jgi:hypothetical protein